MCVCIEHSVCDVSRLLAFGNGSSALQSDVDLRKWTLLSHSILFAIFMGGKHERNFWANEIKTMKECSGFFIRRIHAADLGRSRIQCTIIPSVFQYLELQIERGRNAHTLAPLDHDGVRVASSTVFSSYFLLCCCSIAEAKQQRTQLRRKNVVRKKRSNKRERER